MKKIVIILLVLVFSLFARSLWSEEVLLPHSIREEFDKKGNLVREWAIVNEYGQEKMLNDYYLNGQLAVKREYENGRKIREFKYYMDGKLKSEENSEIKNFSHISEYSYEGVKIHEKTKKYFKGRNTSSEKTYYDDGSLHIATERNELKYPGRTESKTFYRNGSLKKHYLNKDRQEIVKRYDENGVLFQEQEYKKERLLNDKGKYFSGEYKTSYPNGQIFEKGQYRKGVLNGDYKAFYSDGALMIEAGVKKGHYVGDYKVFYRNGNPKVKMFFSPRGKYHGKADFYYENGNLHDEINYRYGVVESSKSYNKNGDLILVYPEE